MNKYLIIFLMFTGSCMADRYLQPTKYEDQEEIFVQGGVVLVSDKRNAVEMYQTSEVLANGRANFFFSVTNRDPKNLQFYFNNLSVTDQYHRPVRVVHKKELLNDKRRQKNWSLFASFLCTGLQAINAQNAGEVQTRGYHTTYHHSPCRPTMVCTTYTQQTTHCEALRQQAMREVERDACFRNAVIEESCRDWEYGIEHFYFDTNTIFPETTYSANFQIEVPSFIERDLQYLVFTYDLNGERHSFCYYCGCPARR